MGGIITSCQSLVYVTSHRLVLGQARPAQPTLPTEPVLTRNPAHLPDGVAASEPSDMGPQAVANEVEVLCQNTHLLLEENNEACERAEAALLRWWDRSTATEYAPPSSR